MSTFKNAVRKWMVSDTTNGQRRRFTPVALATGVLAVALVSGTATGTLSGFVASITNPSNTAGSGVLTMSEATTTGTIVTCNSTDGGTVSTNTATCSTIDKLGGNLAMVPGQTVTTVVAIKNTGTVTANSFTLAPTAACVASANGLVNGSGTAGFCANVNVVITNTTTSQVVFSGTAASLGTATAASFTMPSTVAPGTVNNFSFAVTLASTATNTSQGLKVLVPLVWTFNS